MTPMAHRAPARRYPCPGCATCRPGQKRESLAGLLLAGAGIVLLAIALAVILPSLVP